MKTTTATDRLSNLFEALADITEQMTDEEIIQECVENGEDVDAIAAHMREVLQQAFDKFEASKERRDVRAAQVGSD